MNLLSALKKSWLGWFAEWLHESALWAASWEHHIEFLKGCSELFLQNGSLKKFVLTQGGLYQIHGLFYIIHMVDDGWIDDANHVHVN